VVRLGCLGDSNTFDWGGAKWCDLLPSMGSQAGVQVNVPAFFGATVTHNAKGGIYDAYGQMPMALSAGVDAVILAFGTNDIVLLDRTPEEIAAAYAENVATAEAAGVRAFIALTPPMLGDFTGAIDPRRAATNDLLLRTFPADRIIDFYSTMLPEQFADQIHADDHAQVERARKAYERLLYGD
jgi:lysophospholipase L1-like esterase